MSAASPPALVAQPGTDVPQPRACCVLVLGAGRSGTSVLAAGLQALGVELGAQLRGGNAKNPLGHFEDTDTVRLNRALRRLLVGRRHGALVPQARWATPAVARLEDQAVELLAARFGSYALWGVKNNGTLRFLPFWQRVITRLGCEPVYVAALRDPWSAAQSRHHSPRHKPARVAKTVESGVRKWLVSWVPHFATLRGARVVVVDYARLLAEPEAQLQRLALTLRLPLDAARQDRIAGFAKDFLNPQLRHHHPQHEALVSLPGGPLADRAHGWLERLATDEVRMDDPRLWAAWSELAADLKPLTPPAGPPKAPRPWWRRRVRKLWRTAWRLAVGSAVAKSWFPITALGGYSGVC